MLFLKNMHHQKIIHSDIVVDDEGYNINLSQQTVEQIEVIEEEKKRDPMQFSPEERLLKKKNRFIKK